MATPPAKGKFAFDQPIALKMTDRKRWIICALITLGAFALTVFFLLESLFNPPKAMTGLIIGVNVFFFFSTLAACGMIYLMLSTITFDRRQISQHFPLLGTRTIPWSEVDDVREYPFLSSLVVYGPTWGELIVVNWGYKDVAYFRAFIEERFGEVVQSRSLTPSKIANISLPHHHRLFSMAPLFIIAILIAISSPFLMAGEPVTMWFCLLGSLIFPAYAIFGRRDLVVHRDRLEFSSVAKLTNKTIPLLLVARIEHSYALMKGHSTQRLNLYLRGETVPFELLGSSPKEINLFAAIIRAMADYCIGRRLDIDAAFSKEIAILVKQAGILPK